MAQSAEQIQSELESFRQQWKAEVSARSKNTAPPQRQAQGAQAGPSSSSVAAAGSASTSRQLASHKAAGASSSHKKAGSKTANQVEDEDDYYQSRTFDEPEAASTSSARGSGQDGSQPPAAEPQTALEFYERAVEREESGKLGDSLQLYRKAFRMDSRVDLLYRSKHFPARPKAAAAAMPGVQVNPPPNAAATAPNAANRPVEEGPPQPVSLSDLIASFAGLGVQGAPPEVEGVAAPPCPIADLPDEILVHILRDLAVADVGDFVRLSRVCKRFAYLVATEDQIWRRVCVGPEFGFGGMHYAWQTGISWEPLEPSGEAPGGGLLLSSAEDEEARQQRQLLRQAESRATTNALLHSLYSSSWQKMFRCRPRVRFNGCYISTVNYIRAGQASGLQITWNSPIHIVTYYRYLRLFRDGTLVSLLTTAEPTDVVHHLTRDLVALHRGGAAPHLPSAVVGNALKGRWRLSSSLDNPDVDAAAAPTAAAAATTDVEGDLFIETEGVGPKYMYRMELALKNAGRAARNNKLAWKGFWSYNKLTDDWGEFQLKNDKPFFFSRVKSYGLGDKY